MNENCINCFKWRNKRWKFKSLWLWHLLNVTIHFGKIFLSTFIYYFLTSSINFYYKIYICNFVSSFFWWNFFYCISFFFVASNDIIFNQNQLVERESTNFKHIWRIIEPIFDTFVFSRFWSRSSCVWCVLANRLRH